MRGGGRGGGCGDGGAAAEGAAAIPPAARKLVQSLKGVVAECPEAEIYAMLRDCGMDPDVAVDRLLSQDTFHEVRRKRDKKKEIKGTQESRPRAGNNSTYRGFRGSFERNGRFQSSLGVFKTVADSAGQAKASRNKENGRNSPPISSIPGPGTRDPTETITVVSNLSSEEASIPSGGLADVKPAAFHHLSQVQQSWTGVPGRPSMADIVKMGRPPAKGPSRPVASGAAAAHLVISNAPNQMSEEPPCTVLPSVLDRGISASHRLASQVPDTSHGNGTVEVHAVSEDDISLVHGSPAGRRSEVQESCGLSSTYADPSGSVSLVVDQDGVGAYAYLEETEEVDGSIDARGLTASSRPVSASDREIQTENSRSTSHLSNGLIEKTNEHQSDRHSSDHNQIRDLNEELSSPMTNIAQLSLHKEEEVRPKSAEDNPAVIIPNHLQVSNADCAHLTFGSFVSGVLAGSSPVKSLKNNVEVATVSDNSSVDQSDIRNHEYENNGPLEPAAANEYIVSATSTAMKNAEISPVQQPDVRRADSMNVPNGAQYNLSSASAYASSAAVQPDSAGHTYLQENRQLQNLSPFSSLMQANAIPNGLLPPAMPPVPGLDQSLSQLLTTPPMPPSYSTASSTISGASVSLQENVNPRGFSNPQSTQSQPSTSFPSGPPLPQHLALHPYAQATLPLGPYASMIGYPSLPQSYAYIPPAAFQQPYMNNGLFHQSAAAIPNSGIKYPLPQYKSSIALASLPQPASLFSSYVGGFGAAGSMPGNFAMNQSTAPAATTLGFDGPLASQYKDGNHFISLQQSENAAMWMHGAGSRAMPPLPANTFYGYQGQNQQSGFRQGQPSSQFGPTLGHTQAGLGSEHRSPTDSNSSATAQANQLWPNSY